VPKRSHSRAAVNATFAALLPSYQRLRRPSCYRHHRLDRPAATATATTAVWTALLLLPNRQPSTVWTVLLPPPPPPNPHEMPKPPAVHRLNRSAATQLEAGNTVLFSNFNST